MPSVASPAPAPPSGGYVPPVSAPSAAPLIAAQEQALADYLNLPVHEVLSRLGLTQNHAEPEQPRKEDTPPEAANPPPSSSPSGSGFDAMSLIKPVTDALGTLGSGNFGGAGSDPTQALAGISNAFDTTSNPLQRAVSGLEPQWTGDASSKAADKTGDAIKNGAELNQQAAELRRSLMAAATQVQQSRARLLTIISNFQATIAAIGPNIAFPWGWAAAVAAATQAVSLSVETMTELQATLGTESAATTAAGAPVTVTALPQAMAAMGPLMQLGSAGLSGGTSAISSGIQSGTQASQANDARLAADAPPPGGAPPVGAGGGPKPGGGGGGAAVGAVSARALGPMSAPTAETTAQAAQSNSVRPATPAGMGGAGGGMMGGAPMNGAKAGVSGHDAPSFLHTSDQGDEIVGDLGNVAPPVIGEADPHEMPDIELRI